MFFGIPFREVPLNFKFKKNSKSASSIYAHVEQAFEYGPNKEIKYDKNRTKELEKLGLKVVRFWNYDVLDNSGGLDAVCEKIYGYLGRHVSNPPNPLC